MAVADLELCYITAVDALAKFKTRALSPVELMDAVIARAEAVNPQVNALTYTFYERAREQARKAETKYTKADGRLRMLEGIPCAIKDFHAVRGEITTLGSRIYADTRSDNTAPTVERLFRAGAIMHCRTTTPEFAHSGATRSPLWGITRNPWNLAYGPGGSSGGAGAAVAAGMTTLADGTDGGGSIRIPSSACGLFGYKPPFGRNPLDREHPYESLLHYGPIVRSVADAALMQNVMSGPHDADICSLRTRVRLPTSFDGIKGWKIALSMDLGYNVIDPEVQANTCAAAKVFEDLGCRVEEVDLGWNSGVLDAFMALWESLFWAVVGPLYPRWHYEMDPYVVQVLERGRQHDAARLYNVHAVRGDMYRTLAPVLENYDILIAPTLCVPSVKADHDNGDRDFTIDGTPVSAYGGWIQTYPFNLLSQCPVMSVPTGFASTGVPTGLQIVSRTYDDLRVFRAAAAFETATDPWASKHPPL